MHQLIQLRWIAVVGQIITIMVVTMGLGIELPLPHMLEVLACLIAFNIACHLRWHEYQEVSNGELFFSLLIDVAILTIQLYLSGGTGNPFIFLYLLQIIISAVILKPWSTWTIVGITSTCIVGLAFFSMPLDLEINQNSGFSSLYIQGTFVCFALNAAILVILITRIGGELRERDIQLAHIKQQAAEETHIIRMGLLASGAAHELGTPLATLSVILSDWKRMPIFQNQKVLQAEIKDMEIQLQRCKAIVTGVLLSAGEARGENSVKTTFKAFLDDLVNEWKETRPVIDFEYDNQIEADLIVVSDSTIKQVIFNLLDNALEATAHKIKLVAGKTQDAIMITLTDDGPGFKSEILEKFGHPYQSTKQKQGSGLGLFLVVNVVRKLGGSVAAHNQVQTRGAVVKITIPLSSIQLTDLLG